jgi:hypothetical protein
MVSNKWQRVLAFVCAASFLVTSCTTLDHVSIPGSETTSTVPAVSVGDSVLITTKTGNEKSFKVTAVEPDALAGKHERVLYADMASLSVKRGDKAATTLAVALVVLGILIVVGADALGDGVEEGIDAALH